MVGAGVGAIVSEQPGVTGGFDVVVGAGDAIAWQGLGAGGVFGGAAMVGAVGIGGVGLARHGGWRVRVRGQD